MSITYSLPGADTYVAATAGTMFVECWGSGQGGSSTNPGAGGKGGYYCSKTYHISAGTYNLFVGDNAAASTNGNDSWFDTTSTVIAPGGNSATTPIGDVTHAGGNGGAAGAAGGGGGGGSGGAASVGNDGTAGGMTDGGAGGTALADGGAGGVGGTFTPGDPNGAVGTPPGGGGGGAAMGGVGGQSGRGRVVVTFTADAPSVPLGGMWVENDGDGDLDLENLINRDCPFAKGLRMILVCVPGLMGGPRFIDTATRKHGNLTTLPLTAWQTTTRRGGLGCISMNGAGSVTVPNNQFVDITGTQLTLMCWINRTAASVYGMPIAKRSGGNNAGYQFYWSSSGDGNPNKLVFTVNAEAQVVRSGTVNLLGWHHIAVSYDGVNAYFYMDGLFIGSVSATASINSVAYDIAVGADGAGTFSTHQYDDVRIYARCIRDKEMLDLVSDSQSFYPELFNRYQQPYFPSASGSRQQSLTLLGCGV